MAFMESFTASSSRGVLLSLLPHLRIPARGFHMGTPWRTRGVRCRRMPKHSATLRCGNLSEIPRPFAKSFGISVGTRQRSVGIYGIGKTRQSHSKSHAQVCWDLRINHRKIVPLVPSETHGTVGSYAGQKKKGERQKRVITGNFGGT